MSSTKDIDVDVTVEMNHNDYFIHCAIKTTIQSDTTNPSVDKVINAQIAKQFNLKHEMLNELLDKFTSI
jgi:hypothetical protein